MHIKEIDQDDGLPDKLRAALTTARLSVKLCHASKGQPGAFTPHQIRLTERLLANLLIQREGILNARR